MSQKLSEKEYAILRGLIARSELSVQDRAALTATAARMRSGKS